MSAFYKEIILTSFEFWGAKKNNSPYFFSESNYASMHHFQKEDMIFMYIPINRNDWIVLNFYTIFPDGPY